MDAYEINKWCAAIDLLRSQFSIGADSESGDRASWADELEECGYPEQARLYRAWSELANAAETEST